MDKTIKFIQVEENNIMKNLQPNEDYEENGNEMEKQNQISQNIDNSISD